MPTASPVIFNPVYTHRADADLHIHEVVEADCYLIGSIEMLSHRATMGLPGDWSPHGIIGTAEIAFFGEPSINLSLYTR